MICLVIICEVIKCTDTRDSSLISSSKDGSHMVGASFPVSHEEIGNLEYVVMCVM